jgi:hypothetical protein
MPEIGEIRSAKELGRPNKRGWTKYIWAACQQCNKTRWVRMSKGLLRSWGAYW